MKWISKESENLLMEMTSELAIKQCEKELVVAKVLVGDQTGTKYGK